MNEREWDTSQDPAAMLRFVTENPDHQEIICCRSPRKLRLFACACCRSVWHLLTDERSRRAVEVAERHADGLATEEEIQEAGQMSASVRCREYNLTSAAVWCCAPAADMGARNASRCLVMASEGHGEEMRRQANLLRCVIGNPHRSIVIHEFGKWPDVIRPGRDVRTSAVYVNRQWLTPTVLRLAADAYAGDWGLLPILADAVEDAGCGNADLLGHLRGPGPHARGCHVLDLLLGKE